MPARASTSERSPARRRLPSTPGGEVRYRMRDLCRESGMSRQAIHYYIQKGLLPEGQKAGRNMAYYGPDHMARLQTIKRLQHEHFLPLKAIRALLDGQADEFSLAQRELLTALGPRIAQLMPDIQAVPLAWVPLDAMAVRLNLSSGDLERMVELGLIAGLPSSDGLMVSPADQELMDLFAQLRQAGFSPELGFTPDDLLIYEQGLTQVFSREKDLLLARLGHLPPEQLATLLGRALPVVHAVLVRMHKTLIRRFFAGVG